MTTEKEFWIQNPQLDKRNFVRGGAVDQLARDEEMAAMGLDTTPRPPVMEDAKDDLSERPAREVFVELKDMLGGHPDYLPCMDVETWGDGAKVEYNIHDRTVDWAKMSQGGKVEAQEYIQRKLQESIPGVQVTVSPHADGDEEDWRAAAGQVRHSLEAVFAQFAQPFQDDESVPDQKYPDFEVGPFTAVLMEAQDLFFSKNAEYGNMIELTGVLGAIPQLVGDAGKLRQMVMKNAQCGSQDPANVRDKLMDMIVQAAIGVMMLNKGNWNGIDL